MKHLYKWLSIFNIFLLQTTSSELIGPEWAPAAFHDTCSNDNDFCTSSVYEDHVNESGGTRNHFTTMMIKNTEKRKDEATPWYLRLPLLPVLFATSPTLPQGECKRQAQKYMEELNRGTLWAVRMFDSSTKYPDGIIAGQTRNLGNFDECYQIFSTRETYPSESGAETIRGKYCLVTVKYQQLNTSNDHVESPAFDYDMNESVWEVIKDKGDFRRMKRYSLELALCVPDVCHASDIEKALNEPLKRIGIEQQLMVETGIKDNCQSKKYSAKFSIWAKVYCCVIFGLLSLVGAATWRDAACPEKDKNESLIRDIFLCFSIKRNYKSITEITYFHPGLDITHFLRTLFACGSVFAHRWLQYAANPVVNVESVEYSFTIQSTMIVYNGAIIIDYFFAMSGILLGYHMLVELDRKKRINFIAAIFIRYIRFTPSYLIVILFITLLLPHLGSGPYWESKIVSDSNACASNWWTNILYINNYINTDNLCMFQSWYVTVDFHLYIMALFVIYFFWKMPRRIGYAFLIAIIIGGSSVSFFLSYFRNVPPICKTLLNMQDIKNNFHFTQHYIKTHERLSTYFVGVLGGAIIYDHSLSSWSIPKFWKRFPLVIVATVGTIKLMTMGLIFYDPYASPTPIESALYASLHRLAIGLFAIAGFIQLSVSDGSEFYHKLLKPRWAQPLGKLTYGVYLVHNIFQSYEIGVQRTARTFSAENIVRDFVMDILVSFSLALILAMVIEGPFRKIEKRLFGNSSDKLKEQKCEDDRGKSQARSPVL